MFSIGEFSKITGLTVKTLRFYHDKRLLVPSYVDPQTGYRNYEARQIDRARIITQLRTFEFSVEQIGEMLASYEDEAGLLGFLERQKTVLEEKMRQYRGIVGSLDQIIRTEREARMALQHATFDVEEKTLDTLLIAGVRMKGHYSDCGQGFRKIGKALGRYIAGKAFLLHYDAEYKEGDADFEACMPLRKAKDVEAISVRELPGGRGVTLLHKGPYEQLGRSYAKILGYIRDKGYEVVMPTREVYVKGPGMIFRGNPKNYLTEIQILVHAK
ncbi:MAG TPA: MerR family transcriptional regulator [Gemmataceae bacterium]|nr:MerR family transcriptional regulator [Gemmataceae bacterium]